MENVSLNLQSLDVTSELEHKLPPGYKNERAELKMTLLDAKEGEEYIVKDITTDDEELEAFLFSLGCYSGEPITVVSRVRGGCVVSIKDGRYNIDTDLAKAISI